MTTSHIDRSISRRTALAGLGAGGLGVALAATARPAAAQDAAMASHPLVGTWLAEDSSNVSRFGADGIVVTAWAANSPDGSGNVVFQSPAVGVWEAVDDRSARFTSVTVYSDAAGTFTGTSTLDGYLTVSEDGQTFVDDWTHGTKFTGRDANNNVIGEFTGGDNPSPVKGLRIAVWNVPFPPPTATPEATPAP
jgi:hypothetical protein